MKNKEKTLIVLSGAGISAESGVKTFRDSGGLWENHRIEDVASPEGFARNPQLVLDFYNARRRQLREVEPNDAHRMIAQLEDYFDVKIITQNVDDLHERAGSSAVLHLHGELKKARPVNSSDKIIHWENDLNIGDTDENKIQLRPHIVWFGEEVTEMEKAAELSGKADVFLIIGTSLQVFPAAGLLHYLREDCAVYLIDPHIENRFVQHENFYKMSATEGMKALFPILKKMC